MSQVVKCDRCGKLMDPSKGWIFMDVTFSRRNRDREGNGSDQSSKEAVDREMDLCGKCGKAVSDILAKEDQP